MTLHSQPTGGTPFEVPWGRGGYWRSVVVYGLGVSGVAAARFLVSRGVRVIAFDRRSAEEIGAIADLGCELRLGVEPERLPPDIDGVVVSPGIALDRPLLKDAEARGVPVIGEVELGFHFLRGEVIAVTGSNGKSTTVELAGAFLRSAGQCVEVCGNIGRPVTERVSGPDGRVFVIEMSSFQLETVDTFRPSAAALLNISPDHLDRHCDLAGYVAAKARIFSRQTDEDVAVLNADDPLVATTRVRARRRLFSSSKPVEDGCYLGDGGAVLEVAPGSAPLPLFAAAEVPLTGGHNLENAMAAALLAREHGASAADIAEGLRSFVGLPHRLQRVATAAGVTWYDDSKGTNPAATARSLEGFADGSVHLVLGGLFKGGDLSALASIARRKSRRIYLIGKASALIHGALSAGDLDDTATVEVELCGTLQRAVESARLSSRPGEFVLLSPACASFDQFENFAHRGREFQRLVQAALESDDGS